VSDDAVPPNVSTRRAGRLAFHESDVIRHGMTLAEKIKFLREHLLLDGRELSYREIAQRAKDKGYDLSHQTVHSLEKGEKKNPTLNAVKGIAAAFGVTASFFLNDDDEFILNQLKALLRARDKGVLRLAVKSSGLPTDEAQLLADLADVMDNWI
jgi:transcriptional regulator with XRE-family HTH domain